MRLAILTSSAGSAVHTLVSSELKLPASLVLLTTHRADVDVGV